MSEIDDMIDLEKIPEQALGEIVNERNHQDQRWGESNHDDSTWLKILMEEVGEVAKKLLEVDNQDSLEIDHEIIQVAAVATAWRECRLRNIGEMPSQPPTEERGQVYRIVYRTIAGAKPTFIHVRAESAIRALMAFIDETSTLKVSAIKLDNEYDGPLLNERENFWPASNAPKQMEEVPPPGVDEAVILVAGVPDRAGRVFSEEVLREMAAKEKGYKIRLEYGKVALVAKVTIPVAHVQETNDADDTETDPVVREST